MLQHDKKFSENTKKLTINNNDVTENFLSCCNMKIFIMLQHDKKFSVTSLLLIVSFFVFSDNMFIDSIDFDS